MLLNVLYSIQINNTNFKYLFKYFDVDSHA